MFSIDKSLSKSSELKAHIPSTYSLDHLGTFKTKSGKKIDMHACEQDPHDSRGVDKGFVCHLITATINDNEVGYIKITYVPEQSFQNMCPDLFSFATVHKGITFREDVKDRASVWQCLNRHFGSVSMELPLSSDEIEEQVDWWLEENLREEYLRFKAVYVDRPMVAMSRSEILRQHIGMSLYQVAGKWLAERGFALHSDGPSDEAKAVWEKMCSDADCPASRTEMPDGRCQYLLDYR